MRGYSSVSDGALPQLEFRGPHFSKGIVALVGRRTLSGNEQHFDWTHPSSKAVFWGVTPSRAIATLES